MSQEPDALGLRFNPQGHFPAPGLPTSLGPQMDCAWHQSRAARLRRSGYEPRQTCCKCSRVGEIIRRVQTILLCGTSHISRAQWPRVSSGCCAGQI